MPNVNIPDITFNRLRLIALEEDRTMRAVIDRALEAYSTPVPVPVVEAVPLVRLGNAEYGHDIIGHPNGKLEKRARTRKAGAA